MLMLSVVAMDLFWPAVDDHPQHLLLVFRQRVEPFLNIRDELSLGMPMRILFQGFLDSVYELIVIIRLLNQSHSTVFHDLHSECDVSPARQHDDGQVTAHLKELFLQVQTAHPRQFQIRDNTSTGIIWQMIQEFLGTQK